MRCLEHIRAGRSKLADEQKLSEVLSNSCKQTQCKVNEDQVHGSMQNGRQSLLQSQSTLMPKLQDSGKVYTSNLMAASCLPLSCACS